MIARAVPAEAWHIAPIAYRAREADRRELWASGHLTPTAALEQGLSISTSAWTGFVDDEPVCMFGVAPASLLGGVGVPWMIGTDRLEAHQIAFLRHCRPYVEQMRSLYDVLVNFVDDRNVVAQRWLRWLGFHVEPAEPHGVEGLPFRRFTWRRTDV